MIWLTFNFCVEYQVHAKCYYKWYQCRNNSISLFHFLRFYYQCSGIWFMIIWRVVSPGCWREIECHVLNNFDLNYLYSK